MGIGEYVLHVLEVKNKKLIEIYKFPKIYYDYMQEIPYEELNFGFTSQLLNNYKLLLEYPAIQYKKIIDLPFGVHIEAYYDEKGFLLEGIKTDNIVSFRCFQTVEVKDVDEDGIYEIIGGQNAGMGTSRSIGTAEITLKYDVAKQKMEIVLVDFIEEKYIIYYNEIKYYVNYNIV